MTMGKKIKKAREEKGFSQEYIAERLGVSRQAVYKWENDVSQPSATNLIALSDLLETAPDSMHTENKENMPQGNFTITLTRINAIFLIASCAAQLFIFSVNGFKISGIKYIYAAVSGVFMMMLLGNIMIKSEREVAHKMSLRILLFSIIFMLSIIFTSYYFGGVISFIIGLVLIKLIIKY